MENRTSVLIVGAGPVGLVAACMLQHLGVDFMIVDKKSAPTTTSNALLISMRTLQLLEPLGIAQQLIAAGTKLKGMALYASMQKLTDINVPENLPYDTLLSLAQSDTENILRSYLQNKGVAIHNECNLQRIHYAGNQVIVRLKTPNGEMEVSSKALLACDGYHSFVRNKFNIAYPGDDLHNHFIMIDATWDAAENKNIACAFLQRNLTLMVIPHGNNNTCRLLAEVSRHEKFNKIDEPTLEDMQAIATACVPYQHKISNLVWSSKFWVHEHLAKNYSKGAVFLLGDAAHSHSPAGGMGMNTGMQDAVNLCWKLSLFLQGKAARKILRTYESERRAVAESVVSLSSELTKMMTCSNYFKYKIRNAAIKLFAKRFSKEMITTGQQLNIKYKKSLLIWPSKYRKLSAGMAVPDFRVGGKFQFYRDMNPAYFYILCFATDKNNTRLVSDYIDNCALPIKILSGENITSTNCKHWPSNGYLVIRPDAYIAQITDDAENVITLLNNICKK
jgi:2-polyprenyl-6-methoxyphenol hydroxylase-like FAD-dependent oxidoreductase